MKAILSLLAAFVFGPLGLCACRSAATPVPDGAVLDVQVMMAGG